MKVLVVGGGGREHALAWKLAQSPRVKEVLVAPGNAGTRAEPRVRNVDVAADDVDALLALAQAEAVAFAVVGPEVPLVAGIVDRFRAAGLRCFGPSAAAAQLEGSKTFAKAFMARHGIPTARHAVFTELAPALGYVRERGAPIVIKADGLAAGKGVVVAQTLAEAEQALRAMLAEHAYGAASARVVIEEFLSGEEASYIVMSDGAHVLALASSQDHKRRDDGDRGPNTGGMGAYSPAPVVSAAVEQRVLERIVRPAIAGLMIDAQGAPSVVEFNVRCGDPEAQPILLRLDADLSVLIEAALDGHLDQVQAQWDPRPALGVILASGGYPGRVTKGRAIGGLDAAAAAGCKVFHAATATTDDGGVATTGGRVLCVCAQGADLRQARDRAYAGVACVHFEGVQYRRDIGHLALAR